MINKNGVTRTIGNLNCSANFGKMEKLYNNKEFAMTPMTRGRIVGDYRFFGKIKKKFDNSMEYDIVQLCDVRQFKKLGPSGCNSRPVMVCLASQL